MTTTEVVVGRVGRAHGVKGEVSVELRTDEPARRFAEGAVLRTRTPQGGIPQGPARPSSLTVERTRWHALWPLAQRTSMSRLVPSGGAEASPSSSSDNALPASPLLPQSSSKAGLAVISVIS